MFKRRGNKDEWIGGVRTLSASVTGEGEPYRPFGLLWMDPRAETLLGLSVEHPDVGLDHAAGHLLEVIAEPMDGNPRRPKRIRTASGALAEALALGLADARPPIEIVVAPTPELDEAFDGVEAMLAARGDAPRWLDAGASTDAVAGYFDAMAALHVAAPWEVVPDDQVLFRVDCPALGVEGAVLSVIGQLGVSRGLLLFPGRAAFDAFIAIVTASDAPFDPDALDALPDHVSLSFEHRENLARNVVDEVLEHGWAVDGDEAWPELTLVDDEGPLRSPTDRDLALGESVARAFTLALLHDESTLSEALTGTRPGWNHDGTVATVPGDFDVRIALVEDSVEPGGARGADSREVAGGAWGMEPYGAAPGGVPARPSSTVPHDTASLLEALRDLKASAAEDELDVDEAQRLTEALLERFRESAEAAPFENPLQGPELLARIAAIQLDTTLPALTGQELDEVLLEIVPRTVSAPPDVARGTIETTRALFAWLGREHDLERADELIELLGEDAVRELERRLDEPEEFGPAKALMMEAMAAGVDLSDPKAIDDFMMSRIGTRPRFGPDDPFGDFDHFPPASSEPPLTPEQRRAKQKKRKGSRKAARKARKKNR